MELLRNVTGDVTGDWTTVGNWENFVLAISSTANFDGGTLDIEFRDLATRIVLTGDTANLQFTAPFAPQGVVISSDMQVRAVLSGSTSPNIDGVFLYKA